MGLNISALSTEYKEIKSECNIKINKLNEKINEFNNELGQYYLINIIIEDLTLSNRHDLIDIIKTMKFKEISSDSGSDYHEYEMEYRSWEYKSIVFTNNEGRKLVISDSYYNGRQSFEVSLDY